MILRYNFIYTSTSLVLEKLLLKELKLSGLKGKLLKKDEEISLFVEASKEELETFSDGLSSNIPHSLFLKEVEVESVEEIPSESFTLPSYPRREVPFCPRCQKESLEKSDPFVKCEACGYAVKKSTLKFKNFAKVIEGDNRTILSSLATVVKNGGVVKIKTFNGYKKISLLNEKEYKKSDKNFDILSFDLQTLQALTSLTKAQILALGSFEKPVVSLRVDSKIVQKYPFLSDMSFVRVRLSDDLLLENIMHSLNEIGINSVMLEDVKENEDFNVELDFEGRVCDLKPLEVATLSDGRTVLLKGERALIPKADKNHSSYPIKAYSDNFVAFNYENEVVVYKKGAKLPECKNVFDLKSGSQTFEAAHGAYYSIINEYNLYKNKSCGIYLSKEHNDKVMVYSDKFGMVDYIKFNMLLPKNTKELLEELKNEDDASRKLVENFSNKFPELCDKSIKSAYKKDNIYTLWGIASILLGFDNSGDIKKAAKTLSEHALSFKGKKGPRIDYKLKSVDKAVKLDTHKMLKTAMSFKLAGVDEQTLSFGIFESFAEFISNMVDDISVDYEIDNVCFNGSLFELSNFLDKFYTITSKNYKTLTNKEFILDDMNLGYGIVNAVTKEV